MCDKDIKELLKTIVVLVDTREKENSHITKFFDDNGIKYIRQKLDYGDYSFYLPKNEPLGIDQDICFNKKIVIERKANFVELAANFSKERTRLENEFKRCACDNANMTLIVELGTFESLYKKQYRNNYSVNAFIASLECFRNRYKVEYVFLNTLEYAGMFIYKRFYYYLYDYLKSTVLLGVAKQ